MNIYNKKQRWKLYLLGFAAIIVGLSLYYTNILVNKIAEDEIQKVRIWADAVQNRANLVRITEDFFEEMRNEERKKVELWALAIRRFIEDEEGDIAFYARIIEENNTIPVIVVNSDSVIVTHRNLTEDQTQPTLQLEGQKFSDEIRAQFSVYPPIRIEYANQTDFLYYQDSWIFTKMRNVMDDLIDSFLSEVVINSANVPVIVTDSLRTNIIASGNIDDADLSEPDKVQEIISEMAYNNQPLIIELPVHGECHVFYTHSFLLTQLRYYPVAQLLVIGIFLLVSYLLFSTARNAEQNQVWVGMSKETAHQLGTPISSLIAWIELLKIKGVDDETITEIQKDVSRLENITERFSKIGSPPKLKPHSVLKAVEDSVNYMKTRTSDKVSFQIISHAEVDDKAPLNLNLFGWVLENLCKNAVDAMSGFGKITFEITRNSQYIYIDVSDTGKGIPKSDFGGVFKPGFTSKKRGWGLGLSLSKRIIENYHKGKIMVKNSSPQGTTFRIGLKL